MYRNEPLLADEDARGCTRVALVLPDPSRRGWLPGDCDLRARPHIPVHVFCNMAHVHPPPLKAHLIFDIISTKKHLAAGLPYKLGTEIYEYVDKEHDVQIITTFVGLTDNTARRPGRDVYYTQSDELTKNRQPFSALDNVHMFVVFPGPPPSKLAEGSETQVKKVTGGLSSGRRAGSANPANRSGSAKRGGSPRLTIAVPK